MDSGGSDSAATYSAVDVLARHNEQHRRSLLELSREIHFPTSQREARGREFDWNRLTTMVARQTGRQTSKQGRDHVSEQEDSMSRSHERTYGSPGRACRLGGRRAAYARSWGLPDRAPLIYATANERRDSEHREHREHREAKTYSAFCSGEAFSRYQFKMLMERRDTATGASEQLQRLRERSTLTTRCIASLRDGEQASERMNSTRLEGIDKIALYNVGGRRLAVSTRDQVS